MRIWLLPPAIAWNSWPVEEFLYSFQEFYKDAQYGPDFGYYSLGKILNEDVAEFFNSYTTFPMALSPYFGRLLSHRLESMWISLGSPAIFHVFEFGGGAGQLARDIVGYAKETMPAFFSSLRYTLCDRSAALREQQRSTLNRAGLGEYVSVVEGDATEASKQRIDDNETTFGAILSNELLDEFDPVKLRLIWSRSAEEPLIDIVSRCESWREMYVLQCVQRSGITDSLDMFETDRSSTFCAYLNTDGVRSLIAQMLPHLTEEERSRCFPNQICCAELLLALSPLGLIEGTDVQNIVHHYHAALARDLICVNKRNYRRLRRRGINLWEVKTTEIAISLRPSRCAELTPFLRRHSRRFARFVRLYDVLYTSGTGVDDLIGSWKWIWRPGEELFSAESSRLIDKGYMVTIDYGADMDALLWHQALRPNYEGISIMDARIAMQNCSGSELLCPGLQDMTTSVDFTNFALSGKEHGWETIVYGLMKELERAFAFGGRHDPMFTHLIEQSGGPRLSGIWNWYQTKEQEPWASFKVLIQKRGDINGDAGLAGMNNFPLLPEETDSCWSYDASLPPMIQYFVRNKNVIDPWSLRHDFLAARAQGNPTFYDLMETQFKKQQDAYNDMHLSLLLLDYWMYFSNDCVPLPDAPHEVWHAGISRRLHDVYGLATLSRVFNHVERVVNGTYTLTDGRRYQPYVCMTMRTLHEYCAKRY